MKPGPFPVARIESPCPGYAITTPWGKKPNDHTYWQARKRHTGADYAAPQGSPVLAIVDGTIAYRTDAVLGLIVLLYAHHDDEPITFWLCHLSARPHAPGTVRAGNLVGRVGHTGSGASQGPHLHLEVRKGWTTSWAGMDYDPALFW